MVKFYLSKLFREAQEDEIEYLVKQVAYTNIDDKDLESLKSFSSFFYQNFKQCKACKCYENQKSLNMGFCYDCDTFLSKGA